MRLVRGCQNWKVGSSGCARRIDEHGCKRRRWRNAVACALRHAGGVVRWLVCLLVDVSGSDGACVVEKGAATDACQLAARSEARLV